MVAESFQFNDIWDAIKKDPNALLVKPPKDGKVGKIPTGTLKWVKSGDDETERDFFMTGPPCSAFSLVNPSTNTVRYAKCSLRMVRENELDDDAMAMLRPHARERAQFTNFVRDIEKRVLERVQENHTLYAFKESLDPQRITLNQVIKTPSNPEWSCLMTTKLDCTEGASPMKENIEPEHIRLRIRDVDGKELGVADMRDQDKYLPLFSSVYPYFNTRGEIGLQWKLAGLQIIERGPPRRSELEMSNGPWVANLAKYIGSPSGSTQDLPLDDHPVEETGGGGVGGATPVSTPTQAEAGTGPTLKTVAAAVAALEGQKAEKDTAAVDEPKVKRTKTDTGALKTAA